MKYLFLFFLAMVLLHLFYNYLLLPLLRDKYKYQLFALRDQFRRYELENSEKINPELAEYFKKTINKTINIVKIFIILLQLLK